MKKRIHAALGLACAILLSISSTSFSENNDSGSAPNKRPVGLVGTSYDNYEVRILTNNVIIRSKDETYLFKNLEVDIPWDDSDKYSLPILVTAVKTPATSEQIEKLRQYVEGGR
ncbi:MAG: hypothetical protein GXP32_06400 [Kiritimatiellaeota bacterium]|nr:hypothetical protein [Kiritimatiellota bacterium]